ncbi:hypothetical protein Bbelb_324270 [Branchiostoma belcheri]|nr:hypothetical protein Bbelb_324270 [Branchiostoma belcheri]
MDVLTDGGRLTSQTHGLVERLAIPIPPVVKVGPSDPYITAWGRSGVLTCAVKDARPNITSLHWEKDGEVIDSLRYSTKYSGGTLASPALEIRHISRTDSGVYACVAGHTVRSSNPASIISISEPVTATVSDSVTLQCVADGNPPPNITWSRNGILMRSNVGTVPRDVIIGAIQLKNVQTNDTGTYLCKASNGVGDISTRSTALTIKGLRDRVGASTVAVIVGLTAGLLWLVVCVGLVAYLVRRRQRQKEKKKFAFYYNMGRREPDVGDGGVEEDKEPPPYTAMPAKPETKTSRYGGINTVRRSLGKKDRRYARALYGYRPREDNELTLEVDDVIEVLEGEDGGWCLGYLRGRIGLFPSNYVSSGYEVGRSLPECCAAGVCRLPAEHMKKCTRNVFHKDGNSSALGTFIKHGEKDSRDEHATPVVLKEDNRFPTRERLEEATVL